MSFAAPGSWRIIQWACLAASIGAPAAVRAAGSVASSRFPAACENWNPDRSAAWPGVVAATLYQLLYSSSVTSTAALAAPSTLAIGSFGSAALALMRGISLVR